MILESFVDIRGIAACVPKNSVDNLESCTRLFGDHDKAAEVVKTIGIDRRRVVAGDVRPLDLNVAAAKRLLAETRVSACEIGAVVSVSFTEAGAMPASACQAQRRLGLPETALAFDVSMACSGYVYGLYLGSMLASATGKYTLLLDGDVQSTRIGPESESVIPVLADAGSATLLAPARDDGALAGFGFMTKGKDGDALRCPVGGVIEMDGFKVFRFVAGEVTKLVKDFLAARGSAIGDYDAFVPHQANLYMVRQLAKSVGFPEDRLWTSAAEFGNPASASIPLTIAEAGSRLQQNGRLLLAGFGGGLSAGVCELTLHKDAKLIRFDFE